MNKIKLKSAFAILSLIAVSTEAFAQLTPANKINSNPYQSQVLLRYGQNRSIGQKFGTIGPVAKVGSYYRNDRTSPVKLAEPSQVLKDASVISPNVLPAIVMAGLNYDFYENGSLTTLSGDGTFNFKGANSFRPKVLGGVYFTDASNDHLIVIDSFGFYNDTFINAANIEVAGGNYYIDQAGVLTTIKSAGLEAGNSAGMVATYTTPAGSNPKDWTFSHTRGTGGNYFVKSDGAVATVSSVDGFFKFFTPDAQPKILGGNYFIGLDNLLYTVSSTGNLTKTNRRIDQTPTLLGYSFMQFADGSVLTIDSIGLSHNQILHGTKSSFVPELLSAFPDRIDPASVYLPSTAN